MRTKPKVLSFCIDIDGTLTRGSGTGHPFTDGSIGYIWGVMADELARKESIPFEQAAATVTRLTDEILWWDYPQVAGALGLDHARVWERVLAIQQEVLAPFEDGVRMVKELKRRGFRLYVASNNPSFGCLLKLARAGLAAPDGSKWFDRMLGANLCRGQKWQPGHWLKLLAQANLAAGATVAVGDNPLEDADIPLSVGLGYAVIVDRAQPSAVKIDGRKYIVNSLETVPELFEPAR